MSKAYDALMFWRDRKKGETLNVQQDDDAAAVEQSASVVDVVPTYRKDCADCAGRGFVMLTTAQVLTAFRALTGELAGTETGHAIVAKFYDRLLAADASKRPADRLAPLFPNDLITAAHSDTESAGREQRERLLAGIDALAKFYVPGNLNSMDRLDTAAAAFGRAHSAFKRPGSEVRGASLAEYAAVQSILFNTLADVLGDGTWGAFEPAWREAYDYFATKMMEAQHAEEIRLARSGLTPFPREPRQ